MILLGDNIQVLKDFPDNSIDAIVTDPPYGLSFMGKKWDYDVPTKEFWIEALRVLKPGGHLLSFGGTRTYHRMVVNIEDAGFEIRDQIMWLYGSGFPKSLDVSKAIDKAAGAEREVVGVREDFAARQNKERKGVAWTGAEDGGFSNPETVGQITAPATPEAKQWQGWGTALKPANEPIVLARKPLEKGLTVAENVLKWGTGALNIDGTRIATEDNLNGGAYSKTDRENPFFKKLDANAGEFVQPQGRWPANVLFDEEAAAALDAQSGTLKSGAKKPDTQPNGLNAVYGNGMGGMSGSTASEGGASRFFYVAKASKRERGEGNSHPTVKPIKLMEYLIKLITPPGGVVLDPFAGSGTTCCAAANLGVAVIGIEREDEHFKVAERRFQHYSSPQKLKKEV